MQSVFDGLGAWVWILARIPGTNGDPAKVAALAKSLGFKWLAFKSGERHLSEGCDQQGNSARVKAMVQALHDAGLKCITWHYGRDPRGTWHDEIIQIAQLQAWGVDGHILDMEAPWEFGGADAYAKTYCDALDRELPDFPISHAPVPAKLWHPAFPYDVFTQRLAARKNPGFVMPQAYWTETYKGTWRDMRDKFMPMWKKDVDAGLCRFIGCTYGQQPHNPPMDKIPGPFDPQDLHAFLDLAGEHCSLYTLDAMEASAQNYLELRAAYAQPQALPLVEDLEAPAPIVPAIVKRNPKI